MSKVTPTRRSRASAETRIAKPIDYWDPQPGQADLPDEPVLPTPKRPIGAGAQLPELEEDRRTGSAEPPETEEE